MSTPTHCTVDIAPCLHGRITKSQLLYPEMTLIATLHYDGMTSGLLFSVIGPGFTTALIVGNDAFELRRNTLFVNLALLEPQRRHGPLILRVLWSPTQIELALTDAEGKREARQHTPTTFPPHALMEWARREALLPIINYKTPQLLFQDVCEQLHLLANKIIDTNAVNGFWDISYDSRKVVSRSPKRETDIHPQIRLLLCDLEYQRGLQIVPEYPTGSGRIDFLISGRTIDGNLVNVCVEFKLGHSSDLAHGIAVQLPEYMNRCKTDYGIYAVLCFGSEYPAEISRFTIPNINTSECSLDLVLQLAALDTGRQYIKLVVFDLSRRTPPSKV